MTLINNEDILMAIEVLGGCGHKREIFYLLAEVFETEDSNLMALQEDVNEAVSTLKRKGFIVESKNWRDLFSLPGK